MALSDEEKQRIRDEEIVRIQVRHELRRFRSDPRKSAVFWVLFVTVAVFLFIAVRSHHPF